MARKTKRRRSTKTRKSRRRFSKAAIRFRHKIRKVLDGMRKRGRLKEPRLYGETQRTRKKRHIGHFEISFAEANRVRKMKGRKRLTKGQYNYRVARKLPVTV